MMPSESDLSELPSELRNYRDRLRSTGFELVRFSPDFSKAQAARFRHSPADYEFGIHKIMNIDPATHQIYIKRFGNFSSLKEITDLSLRPESEPESYTSLVFGFFKRPVHVILTLIVPPYALAMLILALLSERNHRKSNLWIKSKLHKLSNKPKFF
ncbi:TPA: hypothetical protein ACPWGL_003252 [Pseudomonas aeruginosa]|nr:hypothetical protein [Pseudomonas aeruginosa]